MFAMSQQPKTNKANNTQTKVTFTHISPQHKSTESFILHMPDNKPKQN